MVPCQELAPYNSLRCVDMVIPQKSVDPTTNLEQLHKQFKYATPILVYG